ncbi:MAG: (Fe-S)-binding protein, partial [Pseudomonadota bacterium]
YVVAPSGSCAGMIRTHYPDLFRDAPEDAARAQSLCAKTFELTDFLVTVLKRETFGSSFEGTVTYHDSCAGLRELGIKVQPRALLSNVRGLALKEMAQPEQCCGFGGTFSVKYGDISSHIAERKCADIAACGTEAVVLGDLGCMLNIEGRLRRRGDLRTQVLHIAEVLAGPEESLK